MSVQMARHHGALSAAEVGDKGVTTRPASTALLSVDSFDRTQEDAEGNQITSGISTNFSINKNQSIFNGFFNRIAVAEVVLDWCIPNISKVTLNNSMSVTVGATTILFTIPDGHYTVADVLDRIVYELNLPTPDGFGAGTFRLEDQFGVAWSATSWGAVYLATTAGGNFTINTTKLQQQLTLQTGVAGDAFPVTCANLLNIRYIDFVSPQLTYNQDLKDNTTAISQRDTLYRWCLAYDNVPPSLDRYGYPIYQGYQEFVARRVLPYPKQILWDPRQPIGQLSFQVYDDGGELLVPSVYGGEMEFQMSLLLSEN